MSKNNQKKNNPKGRDRKVTNHPVNRKHESQTTEG